MTPETETAEATEEERGTDKSPEATDRAKEGDSGDGKPRRVGRAEISNLEIVRHYFERASDRLELRDDLRTARSRYRSRSSSRMVGSTSTPATGSSTTVRGGPTRAGSGSTRRSTSTRCARSPR
jgi:hypothetical protein